MAAAVLIAGVIGGLIAALVDSGSERITDLLIEQRQLLRLVGHVRVIVGAKSRRFADALRKLVAPVDAGAAFLTITHPEEQIKEIVRNTYDYFYHSPETADDEDIAVTLMRWNDSGRYLQFADGTLQPKDRELPKLNLATIARLPGRAFHTREMVISEDLASDSRYKKLSDISTGSMFSYPMWDDLDQKVAFVINVVSSMIKRFEEQDREALDIPMRVFGERLLLEHRLLELRGRVTT